MTQFKNLFFLASVTMTFLAGGLTSRADVVAVGAGVHTTFNQDVNLLLEVKVNQLFFRFSAQAAVSGDENGEDGLPYLDIRFAPYTWGQGVDRQNLRLDFIPMKISRNVAIDQDTTVSVSVIGLEYPAGMPIGDWAALFVQLSMDAVGYKVKNYINELDTLKGFHIAGADVEAGIVAQISPGFSVALSVGGEADANYGDVGGRGTFQSDLKAYVRLAGDINYFVRIWIQLALVAGWDSEQDSWETSPMLTSGVNFHF